MHTIYIASTAPAAASRARALVHGDMPDSAPQGTAPRTPEETRRKHRPSKSPGVLPRSTEVQPPACMHCHDHIYACICQGQFTSMAMPARIAGPAPGSAFSEVREIWGSPPLLPGSGGGEGLDDGPGSGCRLGWPGLGSDFSLSSLPVACRLIFASMRAPVSPSWRRQVTRVHRNDASDGLRNL